MTHVPVTSDPFPQFADLPTMKSEFSYIAQFGQRSKNAAVKSNIGRLADMSFDLLRKCDDLVGDTQGVNRTDSLIFFACSTEPGTNSIYSGRSHF